MPRIDRRRIVGTKIHAYAKHVTSEAMCKRLYGSNWDKKFVDGVVLEARDGRRAGGNRANWLIKGFYIFQGRRKVTELNIRSVKEGNLYGDVELPTNNENERDDVGNDENAQNDDPPPPQQQNPTNVEQPQPPSPQQPQQTI